MIFLILYFDFYIVSLHKVKINCFLCRILRQCKLCVHSARAFLIVINYKDVNPMHVGSYKKVAKPLHVGCYKKVACLDGIQSTHLNVLKIGAVLSIDHLKKIYLTNKKYGFIKSISLYSTYGCQLTLIIEQLYLYY